MLHKWSITWRLSLLVLLGSGAILGAVAGYGYFSAKHLLEEELIDDAHQIALTVSARVETSSQAVEATVQGLAGVIETVPVSTEQSYQVLAEALKRNSSLFGAAIVLSPVAGESKEGIASYVYKTNQGLQQLELKHNQYPWETKDWYVRPLSKQQPLWSEPYFDEGGGNIVMATYSVPVVADAGKARVQGVVTGDMSLESLSALLTSLKLGQGNYAFIVSEQGRFIAHPVHSLVVGESMFSLAEVRQDAELRELGQKMVSKQQGLTTATSEINGKAGWIAYMPIPSTGWSLGIFFSREELMAKVFELNRIQWGIGIIGCLALGIIVPGIARSITKPIRQLEKATRTVAAGDLQAVIPVIPGEDEVAHLAASFASMLAELKTYMKTLQETAVTRERIASELRIANSIQMGLIPTRFPDNQEFELFAILEPAREVGGDFYDFFFLDEEQKTLCLVIGDAADKGIGAAMFMAITRTLLRALAKENQEPAILVSRLNEELASNNETCMFVTLFCAVVHIPTGYCIYANGGHCLPVIIHPDSSLDKLSDAKGAAVGGMEGMQYTEGAYQLRAGDVLFLYTDGVTEAANREKALFGEMRMNQELAQITPGTVSELLQRLRDSVRVFADNAEQSDDITMLAFRYNTSRQTNYR